MAAFKITVLALASAAAFANLAAAQSPTPVAPLPALFKAAITPATPEEVRAYTQVRAYQPPTGAPYEGLQLAIPVYLSSQVVDGEPCVKPAGSFTSSSTKTKGERAEPVDLAMTTALMASARACTMTRAPQEKRLYLLRANTAYYTIGAAGITLTLRLDNNSADATSYVIRFSREAQRWVVADVRIQTAIHPPVHRAVDPVEARVSAP